MFFPFTKISKQKVLRCMEDEVIELAKYRLDKARTDLSNAELNFHYQFFHNQSTVHKTQYFIL